MIELLKDIFAVEVPGNAQVYGEVSNRQVEYMYRDKQGCMNYATTGVNPLLPPGKWSILFTTKEAKEEDWGNVVEFDELANCYNDYEDVEGGYHSSIESGLSLLRSRGLNPDNNFVILKREA
jgi:hypothetical protein